NLKFLNNLQPEWKRHVTIVLQTKNLHEANFTKIYDFLKMNQDEVNELRAECLAKTHAPLAFMAHSQNSYNFPVTHNDQSSPSTHSQQSFPINNKYNPQPSLNQSFIQPPMTSLEDISDPIEAMNAALILFAKAFQLTAPTNNNQRTSSNPRNRQIAQPVMNMSNDRQIQNVGGNGRNQFGQYARQVAHNQQGYNTWQNGRIQVAQNAVQNTSVQNGGNHNGLVVVLGIANQSGTGNIVAARAEGTGNGNQARLSCSLLKRKKQGFNFKQKNLTSWLLQLDKAPVYDTDDSAEVQLNDNYYDNEIFNMFTQKEQYTGLLEPNSEPQLVPRNDNHVTSVAPSMVQSGGTLETSSAPNKETRAHQETVYRNLVDQVAQVNIVNCNMRATNAELNYELARYKIQEQRIKISQEKYDKLEKCYQKSEMALGYPNPSYLKKAQLKQQSLYNGNLLLEDHDPPAVYDSEETLKLAQERREKNEIFKEGNKTANYAKIDHLSASVSHDVMSIMQNGFVDVPSDLQTELDRTKEKLELCIIKKKKEYVVLWNNWYTKYEECKYDKISDDKAYNDMQQKVERLQAQLRDIKGKSSNTPSASNTLDPLNQKLESKIVELEFQVVNYEREISHLKTTYKNLFDSITSNRALAKLHNLIYENAKPRARLFENTSESMNNTSGTNVTPQVDKPKLIVVTPYSKKLHASIPSHSVPQPREFNVVKHRNVIAPGMFKIDPFQTSKIGTLVDATKYRSMIGALMYLMSSRPDIVHATCDSGFELTRFSDADYAGYKDTFKSTSGGAQFLG
nr:hypothetical protein [Tanacetum cinerariifolium]